MLMGLGGVALVVGVESVQSVGEFLGALAMIGAAVCYALSSFVVKGRYGHLAAMQTSLISITVTSVVLAPFALATLPCVAARAARERRRCSCSARSGPRWRS